MYYHKNNNGGYITIIASIIVMIVVLLMATISSSTSFLGRIDNVALGSKSLSMDLARGCLEHARLRLAQNSSYVGSETITTGPYSCEILAITSGSNYKTIQTKASILNKVTNLELIVNNTDLSTISLEEKQSF